MARSPPRSKKSRQDPPKSALKMPILGSMRPSWPHLGAKLANLAPSWPQLGPSWRQDVLPQASEGSPERVPISTLGHLGARRLAEPANLPGAYIFSRFCFHFGTDFVKKLLRMLCKTFVLFSLFPFHAKPGLSRLRPKAWRTLERMQLQDKRSTKL